MEGATFIEDVKMLDDLTPEPLNSCEAFSGNTSCIDPRSNTTDEHVIDERKLGQQFMALTSIVPGIEKMDETTVLEYSIKYLKQLQARVKTLEQQVSKKTIESVVFVKTLPNHSDSESGLSDENFSDEHQLLPQIEARVSDRNVLIRIHCDIHKGVLVKALEETEKFNLILVNSSAMAFGASTFELTLMAQMGDEFTMTMRDLVKSLRSSLIQFMEKNLP